MGNHRKRPVLGLFRLWCCALQAQARNGDGHTHTHAEDSGAESASLGRSVLVLEANKTRKKRRRKGGPSLDAICGPALAPGPYSGQLQVRCDYVCGPEVEKKGLGTEGKRRVASGPPDLFLNILHIGLPGNNSRAIFSSSYKIKAHIRCEF